MGLGWHVFDLPEQRIWWHNGGTFGARSFVAVWPDRGLGIVEKMVTR
jgi:hypothetical protein